MVVWGQGPPLTLACVDQAPNLKKKKNGGQMCSSQEAFD